MAQKFYAHPTDTFTFPNGAIGHRIGGPMDCLGPYAKVRNCPIKGHPGLRLTCYATGYADTAFSVPACTRYRGKHVRGYFATDDNGGLMFHPMDAHRDRLEAPKRPLYWVREGADALERAAPYYSKRDALAAFQDTATDLARYGQRHAASLHIAESRDTLSEYPDCVLSLGPRGGLQCVAA